LLSPVCEPTPGKPVRPGTGNLLKSFFAVGVGLSGFLQQPERAPNVRVSISSHPGLSRWGNGRSMRDITGDKMQFRRACRFIDQISCALEHTHERGILHRDSKSPNVLLEGGLCLPG